MSEKPLRPVRPGPLAEGRATATAVDEFLTGEPSDLPAPVKPRDRGLVLG